MLILSFRHFIAFLSLTLATAFGSMAYAQSNAELERESRAALKNLIAQNQTAKDLNAKAVAVLIFPDVKKAGFIVGGQYGEGVLLRGDKVAAFYNTGGASVGLQAGAQKYGYALFLMTEDAVKALDAADGFEIGVGPSVVVVDQGYAKSTTTTTIKDNIYAFIFDQKGLMAGLGIQGNKITKMK